MKLESRSPEETEETGFRLGRLLKSKDVVALYGDLGAGKTTLVRGIARAFGIDGRDVTSASFTIIAEYPAGKPFYHIDLYRVENTADLEGTGIWDCLGSEAVCVVEWAERLAGVEAGITVKVTIAGGSGEDERLIAIEGIDEEDWHNL